MSWNPAPTDPKNTWAGYEFCICTVESGLLGGPEIDLLYRNVGASDWFPVGASDGIVYMDESWNVHDFPAWYSITEAEINKRLLALCKSIGLPSLQVSHTLKTVPASFEEFRAWLKPNVIWSGNEQPATGVFPLWIHRVFAGGHAFEVGVNQDGSPACRVMIQNVGWKVLA